MYGLAKFSLFALFPLVQFISMMYMGNASSGIVLTIFPLIFAVPFVNRDLGLRVINTLYIIFLSLYPIKEILYAIEFSLIFNVVVGLTGMMIGFYLVFDHFEKNAKRLKGQNDKLKFQNSKLETLINQNNHKTELLGILSHNLKGPAASFDQLSKKVAFLIKNERFEDLQAFGEYFESTGDKIFQDIDRLLNWTMSQKNDIIITNVKLSPFKLVSAIKKKLELHNSHRNIRINVFIPIELEIKSDNQILEIILNNLLSNAVNNTQGKEEVTVRSSHTQSELILSISNDGPRIDMKIVEQAKSGKYQKSSTGHGLGIGICFSLIKFLEGNIMYTIDESNGTTVKVILPLRTPTTIDKPVLRIAQ